MPKSAIQLLMFYRERRAITGKYAHVSKAWNEALEQLDWDAVYALVK